MSCALVSAAVALSRVAFWTCWLSAHRHQRVHDNDAASLTPAAMLTDLLADNQELIKYLRTTHDICDQHEDVATASLIENWIDETENRAWFLYEILYRA